VESSISAVTVRLNQLDRYSIGDRAVRLPMDDEGSFTVVLQRDHSGLDFSQ
jgi:hypothetical protein